MGPEQTTSPLVQLVPFILIGVIMYFIVLKPEKNKQNEKKKQIANLKKNDQIVSMGGIHGTIVNIKETTLIVRIDDNAKIELDKEAVSTVITK